MKFGHFGWNIPYIFRYIREYIQYLSMKFKLKFLTLFLMMLLVVPVNAQTDARPVAKKILFIGDSMTGWLAERLGAYGKENGFEVATVIWDGSTIKKWGTSPKLTSLIATHQPDALFVSLGMNDLFETNPAAKYKSAMEAIKGLPAMPRSSGSVLRRGRATTRVR